MCPCADPEQSQKCPAEGKTPGRGWCGEPACGVRKRRRCCRISVCHSAILRKETRDADNQGSSGAGSQGAQVGVGKILTFYSSWII